MEEEEDIQFKEKLAEIETAISKARGKIKENVRLIYIFLGSIFICAVLLTLHYTEILLIPKWIVVSLWVASASLISTALSTDIQKYKSEIDNNEIQKEIFKGLPEPASDAEKYFSSLVEINLKNLSAYYTLVKVHTSQSFRAALMVSIIGFLLLIGGLTLGFQFEKFRNMSFIASGAGLIIEFISGVLFFLYNKTIIQLKDYHDSLIDVQNVLLSFKLIETTKDPKIKAEMIGKMIEYLVKNK